MQKYLKIAVMAALAGMAQPAFATADRDSAEVRIAYGSQSGRMVTSAVSTVSGDELVNVNSASVGNALTGKLAGLTLLQQSGQPGYDFSISNLYMRGRTTYASGQNMLVFVDGFESTIDNLTAAEIESVSLLKDASALAIYGARGANGVLLVTTKRGMDSKPDIKVRLQTGLQTMLKTADPVDSYTYASLYNQACKNDGVTEVYGEKALTAYKEGTDGYLYPNVNWKKEMLRKVAPISVADLSFRGGNKIVKYYVLLSAANNSGFFKGTDFKKDESANASYTTVNVRSNIDINIGRRFSTAFSFGGQIGSRAFPGGGTSAYKLFNSMYATAPNAFPVYNPDGSFGGNASQTNPVGELLYRGVYKENNRTFQLVFTPKLDLGFITEGLSVSASVAYSNNMCESSTKSRNYTRYSLTKTADGYEYTPYGTDEPLEAGEGFKDDWSRVNAKCSLDYSRRFGKHSVDATAFALVDNYRQYSVRANTRYVNFAGRVTYSYAGKYIAEFSASDTGCDDYAKGHRFGFFPAGSAGWVISEEPWLKNFRNVNYLKLRASAGLVGNNQNSAGRYLFDESYAWTGSYLLGTGGSASSSFGVTTIPNIDLSWEKETIYNVGIDAELFGALTVNADVFTQTRTGIVDQATGTIPGFVGASFGGMLPYMNVGKVRNSGFELTADWHQKKSDDMQWHIGAGVWFARNEIKEMGEPTRVYEYQYRRGHAVGTPFVLVADGYWKQEDFNADGSIVDGLPVPQYGTVRPGDIKYIDQNNDGIIDSNDGVPVGYSYIPEWNFTLNGGLKWKRFELEVMFQGVAGRDIYLSGNTAYSFQDNASASQLAKDSWTPENTDASYPRLSLSNFSNNYRTSTFWKRSGSYLRLKNLYLAYNLPTRAAGHAMCLYVNGTNLFTINASGVISDPESSSLITYPLTRTVSVGMKFTF